MLVCGQEFSNETIQRIASTVEKEPEISRRELSRRICQWLEWRGYNGKPKLMSCRTAILKLHRRGLINLPKPVFSGSFTPQGKAKGCELEQMSALTGGLEDVGEVELVLVDSRHSKESGIWNGLMDQYHYLKRGPLCGGQLRYLIKSSRWGWLGGLSISGAAWQLEARDKWIGWSVKARKANLPMVVCNSRFLIRPQIKVANLASHVLSLCAQRLRLDWKKRYGYEPVMLETFVDQERYQGTIYQAANWHYVGSSAGRGRQDRKREKARSIKEIYAYPLNADWRERLCVEPTNYVSVGTVEDKASSLDWAEEEFGAVALGDERLTERLITIARDFYARPQANIPQACSSRAKTKAAYRFFEHPQTDMDKLLRSHYEATAQRIGQQKVVLAVQDTTSLNYSMHPATERLGPISTSKDGVVGLMVHDTMAFGVEGAPLGLMDVQCWARDEEEFGKRARRHEVEIEQKESYKWLKSFQAVAGVQKRCKETTLVSVGDREADIYELFLLAQQEGGRTQLLVRAKHNRAIQEEQGHLWEKMAGEPLAGIQEIRIPRRGVRKARTARLAVRYASVELRPPKRKAHLPVVKVWAVWANEEEVVAGVEPLEWMLLCTQAVNTFPEATEKLSWYARRWGIEVYHRTLKSGCQIETRQLGHADRIEACLAIDMVVAWRIFHLAKLGRETPNVPCSVYFEEEEWKALVAFVTRNPVSPEKPPTLREAIRMVGSLGGFLGRKGDGEPGTQTLWLGIERLDDIAETWKIMVNVPHQEKPTVSSSMDCG